jgi:UDP-N-acetylmuramyl pentapeptide phosphotransferase/UDP-N-acetylglucosamine-1-phosphate transferase
MQPVQTELHLDSGLKIAGLCLLVAGACTFLAEFFVLKSFTAWKIIDLPNERSNHTSSTVRGGGIAIVVVLLAVIVATGFESGQAAISEAILGAVVLVAAVSFVDDFRSVPALVRLIAQALATAFVLGAMHWPKLTMAMSNDSGLRLASASSVILSFLWIVGYTNAFNFMDGIDGIAAVQAALTASAMGVGLGVLTHRWQCLPIMTCAALAGATLGFLPHNFPRAKIFMGDVGSAPIGFMLAILVVWIARDFGWWLLIPLLLLQADFVLDTGFTLLRRMVRGERWYAAHREHFYQRFVRAGRSHKFVTGWVIALQLAVIGLVWEYVQSSSTFLRFSLILAVLGIWTLFFSWAEWEFRRSRNPVGRAV